MKIDMHTHILPEKLPDFGKQFGYGDFIHLEPSSDPGRARMMRGTKFFREIESNCWDPKLRIEEYDALGVPIQIVCTIPVMFSYWAKPEDTWTLSKYLNDHIAELVAEHPSKYVGLGTLPMQSPELAIKELERCKSLGMPGVQIGSNINQENLGDNQYFPFWEACRDLGMAVLVHPWEMMGEQHMTKYWLPWLVGMPAETARAVASMVFSGVFEKLPGLRVNYAHAGGSFLPTLGRLEHGFNCRPDLVAIDNPHPPSSYLGKFWVDCITHDPKLLLMILDMVGPEKVTLGSDYPFPLGDLTIGSFLDEMGLSEETLQKIHWKNTGDWLGIDFQSEVFASK
jgi:aminocarboxymuconate-semialdehyde decarboxylase